MKRVFIVAFLILFLGVGTVFGQGLELIKTGTLYLQSDTLKTASTPFSAGRLDTAYVYFSTLDIDFSGYQSATDTTGWALGKVDFTKTLIDSSAIRIARLLALGTAGVVTVPDTNFIVLCQIDTTTGLFTNAVNEARIRSFVIGLAPATGARMFDGISVVQEARGTRSGSKVQSGEHKMGSIQVLGSYIEDNDSVTVSTDDYGNVTQHRFAMSMSTGMVLRIRSSSSDSLGSSQYSTTKILYAVYGKKK